MKRPLSPLVRSGLILVLVLTGIRFGLQPLYANRERALTEIARLQRAIARKQALQQNQEKLAQRLDELDRRLYQTRRLYYRDFSKPENLQLKLQKEIEKLAAAHQVKLNKTYWLQPEGKTIVQAPLNLRATARPAALYAFLTAIESQKHFLTIDRIRISVLSRQKLLNLEMDLSAWGLSKNTARKP